MVFDFVENAGYPIYLLKACPIPQHYSLDFCQIMDRNSL